MKNAYQIVIIGGGPAGLAAAVAAYDNGAKDVLILEREETLGGILNQCIHNGFGLARFKESLSGPEYAERFVDLVRERKIDVLTGTTVLSFNKDKQIVALNSELGEFTVQATAVILAMGCRERSKGALNIAGTRPSGLFSAGAAQKFVNIKGYMPGKTVVVLGSGDIGLIMARRMTLEGAKVLAVFEIMPYSSGLKRNVVQCLEDFDIPLYLNHTIVKIEGQERVNAVVACEVDENRNPIAGTEKRFECDTVLFSVGLIPENELTKAAGVPLSAQTKGAVVYQNRETEMDGVFACGNALQVHDLVDFVSEESEIAGKAAAEYVLLGAKEKDPVSCVNGDGITYVLPQKLDKNAVGKVKLFFRVREKAVDCQIVVKCGGEEIARRKKRVVTPGEMETFILTEEQIKKAVETLTVSLEK